MIKTYDAGGDWCTLTLRHSSPDFNKAVSLCEQMVKEMETTGETIKPGGLQGYTGYHVGQLFCGTRNDGMLIQGTSGVCKYVEEKVRQSGIEFKATRYDLQTTIETSEQDLHYAQRMCAAVALGTGDGEGEETRRVVTHQGAGVYSGVVIGSGVSTSHLRFYDKTLEQRGLIPPNLWRLEVQYRQDKANFVWAMAMRAGRSYYLACSLVPIEFARVGFDISWAQVVDGIERPTSYHRTDKEKKLGWLENHVRSSVFWLKERGYEAEAREALGL